MQHSLDTGVDYNTDYMHYLNTVIQESDVLCPASLWKASQYFYFPFNNVVQ